MRKYDRSTSRSIDESEPRIRAGASHRRVSDKRRYTYCFDQRRKTWTKHKGVIQSRTL